MKSNNSRILSVLLISFSLIYSSCTLIGLGIGATVDATRSYSKVVEPADYETIGRLEEITVHFKDNSIRKGKFVKITEQHLTFRTGHEFGILEIVNLDKVLSIKIKVNKNSGKLIGLKFGLALDLVAIVALISFLQDYEGGT